MNDSKLYRVTIMKSFLNVYDSRHSGHSRHSRHIMVTLDTVDTVEDSTRQ